jgi:hypothetical protein
MCEGSGCSIERNQLLEVAFEFAGKEKTGSNCNASEKLLKWILQDI